MPKSFRLSHWSISRQGLESIADVYQMIKDARWTKLVLSVLQEIPPIAKLTEMKYYLYRPIGQATDLGIC